MPPAENIPRPPIGYYLFDTYGSQPRSAPIPEAPTADELQSMLISLSALQNSATKRAKSTADAIKVGRESLARSAYAYKLGGDEADATGKYKRGGDEKGVLKKGLGAGYPRAPTGGLGSEPRRKDGSINGVKVKREASASPAPTAASEYARPSSSRLGTPVDQMSERASMKIKKRKVTHHGSPEPDSVSVSSHRGRAGSTTREGSVSGGQDRAASYTGSHAERPSMMNQSQGSGLKVKLSLSNSGKNRSSLPPTDVGTSPLQRSQLPATGTESAVQQVINFSLPSPSAPAYDSLVPVRPPIPHPPKPLPKRQKDVNQDFSTVKHVTQNVQWTTFWNGVEPYLKDFGEEELAMLGFRPEDVEPFIVPPLGKHYQDIWDEEDSALPFASTSGTGPPAVNAWDVGGKAARPLPRRLSLERTYIPVAEMVEEDLWDEAKGLGGLNERAVAALMRVTDPAAQKTAKAAALSAPVDVKPPTTPKGKVPELQVNGDTVSPKTGPSQRTPHREPVDGAASDNEEAIPIWPIRPHRIASPPKRANEREKAATLDVELAQLEQGVAREMRLLGLMGEEETVDWSLREDDEISSALRQCQRLLKTQVAVNNARKDRLLQVTKERLAYSEYKKVLEGLEKLIEQAWVKRYAALKKAGKKQKGKGKEHAGAPAAGVGDTGAVTGRREGIPPLSDQVKLAMDARRRWLNTVGAALEGDPIVGRYRGLPVASIYAGIDERGREVQPLRMPEPDVDEEG